MCSSFENISVRFFFFSTCSVWQYTIYAFVLTRRILIHLNKNKIRNFLFKMWLRHNDICPSTVNFYDKFFYNFVFFVTETANYNVRVYCTSRAYSTFRRYFFTHNEYYKTNDISVFCFNTFNIYFVQISYIMELFKQ